MLRHSRTALVVKLVVKSPKTPGKCISAFVSGLPDITCLIRNKGHGYYLMLTVHSSSCLWSPRLMLAVVTVAGGVETPSTVRRFNQRLKK